MSECYTFNHIIIKYFNMIDKHSCYAFLLFLYFVFAMTSGGFFLTYLNQLDNFYKNKKHGVHETEFNFTGEYIINSVPNNKYIRPTDYMYVAECLATTKVFNNCTYKIFESSSIHVSTFYATNNCINSTSINGFISTSNKMCTLSNPNDSIQNTLLKFHISCGIAGFFWLIILILILYIIITYKKNDIDSINVINQNNNNKPSYKYALINQE